MSVNPADGNSRQPIVELACQLGADNDRTPISRKTALIGLLAMVLLAYFLLSVPLLIFADRLKFGRDPLRVVFAPVGWLHDRTPMRYPIRWYASLWGVHPD